MDPTSTAIPDLSALPPNLAESLYLVAGDVVLIAMVVVALITTAKHVLILVRPDALDGWVGQALLEVSPLALGALIGIVPGMFEGQSIGVQAALGLVAGFMSPTIYGALKRRFPAVMLPSQERAGGESDG